jgi:hypothetical protein
VIVRRTSFDPTPPNPTILAEVPIARSEVKKLWRRQLRTGEHVSAVVFLDVGLGECTLEVTFLSSFANGKVAEEIAAGVLATLEKQGAKPFEEPEASATRAEVVDEILKEIE